MRKINFFEPDITESDVEAVASVLRSGWITTGNKTKEFEREIATYCGTEKAVCLSSATACLTSTLRLLGIGEGDEVITTAFTYTATISAIIHAGATPVLVDTLENSWQMDLKQVKKAITTKTKAIICVDFAGMMCDYDGLLALTNDEQSKFKSDNEFHSNLGKIAVISDGAHSFGSVYKGRTSGSVADFTCFSFHAVKNLTTGEGGAVTWRSFGKVIDDAIYKQFMLLSLHGQTRDALSKTTHGTWEYDIVEPYYKCNMTDISAGLGLSQLKRYKKTLEIRQMLTKVYDEQLESVEKVSKNDENYIYNGHLYIVKLTGRTLDFRNDFIKKMSDSGISVNVHFKPIPLLSAYKKRGFLIENYQNAYNFYENLVSLPLHNHLTIKDVEYIAQNVEKLMEINDA